MKKYIIILFLTVIGSMCFQQPCHAGFFSDRKIEIINNYQQIKDKKAIKKVMEQQTKYAVKYDYSKLYNLYSDNIIYFPSLVCFITQPLSLKICKTSPDLN